MANMDEFNPYRQSQQPYLSYSSQKTEVEKYDLSPLPRRASLQPKVDLASSPTQPEPLPPRNLYWKLSNYLGFRERHSLWMFFVFGGAMLGFCLSRMEMFSPSNVEHRTVPGEWFWYKQKLYKPTIFIHIYLTTIGGILSGTQFIPAFRRRGKNLVHRINGYTVILFLIVGTITGAVVARHSMGGDVNTQSAFYVLTFLIVGSLIMGISNVKRTPIHRRWMLRAVFYLGSVITARIVKMISIAIVNSIGTFYSVWNCEEIAFVLGSNSTEFKTGYPQCVNPYEHIAVRASNHGTRVNEASTVRTTFGMALWVGLVIHAIGIEFYIFISENSGTHFAATQPST